MSNTPQVPELHILQYLRRDPKPSWVRVITTRALRVIGTGYLFLWLFFLDGLLDQFHFPPWLWRYQHMPPFAGWTHWHWNGENMLWFFLRKLFYTSDYFSWISTVELPYIPAFWLAVIFLITGVLVFCNTPYIRRGRVTAARIGIICLYPALLMAPTLAALCMALAAVNLRWAPLDSIIVCW